MKELSVIEKAKRYDEALTKARNIVNSINVGLIGKDSFEAVFPELKESEDENIRKDLIQWINEFPDTIWRSHYKRDILAWLEKQGEQKHAWSKEDEEHLNSIISDIKTDMGAYTRSQEVIDIYNDGISFLKSLKERIQSQPKQEWSEEDEDMKMLALMWQ